MISSVQSSIIWIRSNKKIVLFFVFLVLLTYGAYIRIHGLGEKSFWIDESISALTAKKIHEHGYPLLESGFVYSGATVFHYLMSGFLIFGYSEFNARLISVLFGIATGILIYFMAAEYDKNTAWIAFVFLLFLEIFVVYSRQARMYQMEMFLFFLTVFLIYKSIDKKIYLIGAGLSFLLAYDTHPVALLLLPLFFYSFLRNRMDRIVYIASGLVALYLVYLHFGRLSDFRLLYLVDYFSHLKYYAPFVFVSFVGIALTWKNRLTWFLGVSAALLLIAVGFEKLFASRYIYLLFFPMILMASAALSKIRLKWIVIAIYIIWLSNIFNPFAYSFILIPERNISHEDTTEPRAEFRQIYQELEGIYEDETLIVSFTPAAEWYFKKPDYWIFFSFNRIPGPANESFTVYGDRDVYTGAELIYDLEDIKKIEEEKFVVIDDWAAGRIAQNIISSLEDCTIILEKEGIKIYGC